MGVCPGVLASGLPRQSARGAAGSGTWLFVERVLGFFFGVPATYYGVPNQSFGCQPGGRDAPCKGIGGQTPFCCVWNTTGKFSTWPDGWVRPTVAEVGARRAQVDSRCCSLLDWQGLIRATGGRWSVGRGLQGCALMRRGEVESTNRRVNEKWE